jgi:cell wall-associated NlpC family hydrolase
LEPTVDQRRSHLGRHRRPSGPRLLSRTRSAGAAFAVAAALTLAAGPALAAPVPPRPTPTDVAQAQAAAQQASHQLAHLHGKLLVAARRVEAAAHAADHAQARFSAQLIVQHAAADRARRADQQTTAARAVYERDHAAFVRLIASVYESGGTSGGVDEIGNMLAAPDPSAVLATAQTRQMIADQQAQVVDRARAATAAYRSAQQRQQAALAAERRATAAVRTLRDRATLALSVARTTMRSLHRRLITAKAGRATAEQVLSSFLGGWTLADPARADELNRKYLALAQRAAGEPPAPRRGSWTAAMGQSVAWRALLAIGTPYAWAGGNAAGPTTGVCASGPARHDCQVRGFDCSGLSLYGWAPYLALPHLASAQYSDAGHLHPAPTDLLPGDLVFWSSNGRVAGIHHVAVYVGDGNVVQAPQSGDIVRVTPLGSVDSGYFGATRPLS